MSRQMGCSPADLIRWLPLALGNYFSQASLVIDGSTEFQVADPLIELRAQTRPPRTIALLSIPIMELSISFSESFSPTQCEEIMHRFDLYTRRGGG